MRTPPSPAPLPASFRVAPARLAAVLLVLLSSAALAGNVRDYGAVGDGAADDTAAIERALAESGSGEIVFPKGDYRITRTIEISLRERGRTSLSGEGGTGRVVMAGAGPAFRFVGSHAGTASPAGFAPETWERERMPQVEALEILGAHPEADGIEFVQTMQPTLRGVLVREVRHGVLLSIRNRNLLIDACHIYNCSGVGVLFDRVNLHQAIVQGSHISYCKGGGIKIVDGEIRNFQITGNDIEYNFDPEAEASADIWFDIREGTVAEGTIASNTIQARPSPGGANIRFVGPAEPKHRTPMSMWTISGNVIGNQEVNIHLENCQGVAISGNHIYTGQRRNLVVERGRHIVVGQNSFDQSHNRDRDFANGITVRDSDGVVLSGLVLDDAVAGAPEEGGAIELFDSRETVVAHCQIFEPGVRGIWASGCRNLRLADNTVMERGDGTRMLSAIEVRDPAGSTLITGNLVGTGARGDIVASGEGVAVEGNHPAGR